MSFNLYSILNYPNTIEEKPGYFKYITPEFNTTLEPYLACFEKYRLKNNAYPILENQWKALPFGDFAKNFDWKYRQQSLAIFTNYCKNQTFKTTLEIGCWNGWLSKHIATYSENVICTDYWTFPNDGISNIKKLAKNIIPIQCNNETISTDFKKNSFDLIVLNHCVAFFKNPISYLKKLVPLLKPNGKIIALGVVFFKNTKQVKKNMEKIETDFFAKNKINLFFQPSKKYLSFIDYKNIKELNFSINEYPKMKLRNFYSKFFLQKPFYTYITYCNNFSE